MNNRIKELADRCFSTLPHEDELEKFAELVIQECLIEFYRQYFDDESEDITVQVNRYIEDLFRSDDRLDKIEALLRKQANVDQV